MARGLGSWVTAGSQLCNKSSECVCGQPVLKQPKMPISAAIFDLLRCWICFLLFFSKRFCTNVSPVITLACVIYHFRNYTCILTASGCIVCIWREQLSQYKHAEGLRLLCVSLEV